MIDKTSELTEQQRLAIRVLATTDSVAQAARAANVSRSTIYRWMKREDFLNVLNSASNEVVLKAMRGAWQLSGTRTRKPVLVCV